MSYFLYVAYNKSSRISKIGRTSNIERRETELIGFSMVSTYEVSYSQAIHLETLVRRAFIPCEGLEYFKDSPENICCFIGLILSKNSIYKYSKSPLISKMCISFGSSIKEDIGEDIIFSRSAIEDKDSYVRITHYSDNKIIAYTYADSIFRIIVNKGGYGTLYAENCIGNPVPYKTAEQFLRTINKFSVSSISWAFYLPSDNKQRDLKTLEYLYLRMSAETDRRFLASYLGLSPHVDPAYPESCFMLRKVKKNGKGKTTSIMSIAFYDKQAELIEKNKKINKSIKKALESSIRVDITAHKPWLESLVSKAKKHVASFPSANQKKYELFLNSEAIDTYTISRVMSILRIYKDKNEWICGSFSKFLIEDVLIGTMKLDVLLSRQNENLNKYSGNKKNMIDLWKSGVDSIVKTFADNQSISLKQSYAIRNSIETDQISLDIPFKLWLELDTLDIVYGLSHKDRESLFSISDSELKKTLIRSRNTVKNSRLELGKSLQKALELRAKPLTLIKG